MTIPTYNNTPFKKCNLTYGGPALIFLIAIALMTWTWRKWPDVLIDFGRELYIPWQILEGKVLYGDLPYFNGPLSPYLNALWFRIFGVSLITLAVCNFIIALLIALSIYYIIEQYCNKVSALVSSIIFLFVFAFGNIELIGNYNYISPYSHEMTHGIALAIFAIYLFTKVPFQQNLRIILLLGIICGLIFLTKAEIFIATAVPIITGLGLLLIFQKISKINLIKISLLMIVGAMLPITIFAIYFIQEMPINQALQGILGNWVAIFSTNVANCFFYKNMIGLNNPISNSLLMLRDFFGLLLIVAGIGSLSIGLGGQCRKKAIFTAFGIILLVAPLFIGLTAFPPWIFRGRSLSLVITVSIFSVIYIYLKNRNYTYNFNDLFILLIWLEFALILLAKTFLKPSLSQYSFILSMPASILLIVILLGLSFPFFAKFNAGKLFHFFIGGFILIDLITLFILSEYRYNNMNYKIGAGNDTILTYDPDIIRPKIPQMRCLMPRGPVISKLIKEIKRSIPPSANFVVLPEGIMINYLLRRSSPIGYVNFMPPELAIFGESTILAALKKHPPDFIILIDRDVREYGMLPFGEDSTFGKLICDWIYVHYKTIWQTTNDTVGVKMLQTQAEITNTKQDVVDPFHR